VRIAECAGSFPDDAPHCPSLCGPALAPHQLAVLVDFCDFGSMTYNPIRGWARCGGSMPYDPILGWYAYPPSTLRNVEKALCAGEPAYELHNTVDARRMLLVHAATNTVVGVSEKPCRMYGPGREPLCRRFPRTLNKPVMWDAPRRKE